MVSGSSIVSSAAKPLNIWLHCPQRTSPPCACKCSGVTRKTVKQLGHRVAREQIPQTGNAMYAGLEDDMLDNYLPEHYASRGKQLPEITAAWAVANLFMLIVLVAQVIYAFRSDLAVHMPGARPFLEQYCRVLQCTVSLPPSTGPENTASSGMTASPSVDLAAPADKRSPVSGHYRGVHSPSPPGQVA